MADPYRSSGLNQVQGYVEEKPVFNIRARFLESLNSLLQQKSNNSELLTREKYSKLIADVKEAKGKLRKQSVDYRRLKKYDVIEVEGKEKLIVPHSKDKTDILYYVDTEELFDLLHDTHLKTGHGGRQRMDKVLLSQYKNVTKEVIMMYLRLCKPCQAKLAHRKKGVISKEFNSRCQVDVIDMESNPDGEYKFILRYQDHLTKFLLLRPLKSKRVEEIANQVLDIFTIIGAPSVLQSDNGREFASHVVNELQSMWPELKIVHGNPRHGQSQSSLECAKQDVQNKVMTCMETNASGHWAESLRFIQFMKNRSYRKDIQQTPHEAMFGSKAKVGLTTANLPREVIDNINTDEDLEDIERKMP